MDGLDIQLYNTLTNSKETFKPVNDSHVKMYVCGPTVYDYAHVGNAKSAVVFDVLFRLLKKAYPNVSYVRNYTDVDDKIIEAAKTNGESITELTSRYIKQYEEDMASLNVLPPTSTPKATDYIDEMIDLISTLFRGGYAYTEGNQVLLDVSKVLDYGKLSNRLGTTLTNKANFTLWKPSSPTEVGWDSPWGRGRPGWHTECSSMIKKELGSTIDIHGGGQDLTFPHHENEIAQSRCAYNSGTLAKYWVHNGLLNVEGKAMSKSVGNVITVKELLENFSGEAVRLALLMSLYRQPTNFSKRTVEQAEKQLNRWRRMTLGVKASQPTIEILKALSNDMNTPRIVAELNKLSKEGRDAELKASANLIGLLII